MNVQTNHMNGNTGGDSTIRTRLPLEFYTLNGEAIPVVLSHISFHLHPGASCEITFEVNGDVGDTIISNELFHLFQGMVNERPTFDPNQPVEIRALLRPNFTKQIIQHGGDAETVLNALLLQKDPAKKQLPLNQTESWLALKITQNVKLPADLQESGELKQGLQTSWLQFIHPGATKSEVTHDKTLDIANHVEHFLQSKALQYERVDERIIRVPFRNDKGSWVGLIRLEPEDGMCVLYSVFKTAIPERLLHEVALRLMSENYDLVHGNFEMDDQDGELRFRTTYVVGDSFKASEFALHLHEHLQVMDHFLPIIEQVVQ